MVVTFLTATKLKIMNEGVHPAFFSHSLIGMLVVVGTCSLFLVAALLVYFCFLFTLKKKKKTQIANSIVSW